MSSRLPVDRRDQILAIIREMQAGAGSANCFLVARALHEQGAIKQSTALEYINAAIRARVIRRVGGNLIIV